MSNYVGAELEIWALIAVNFLGVFLGIIITGISYFTYRSSNQKKSLQGATVGFGLLTIGIAIEPIYQLTISGTHILASDQNVRLQLLEGLIISLGFLVLFSSIYGYSSHSQRQTVTVSGVDDDLFDKPD